MQLVRYVEMWGKEIKEIKVVEQTLSKWNYFCISGLILYAFDEYIFEFFFKFLHLKIQLIINIFLSVFLPALVSRITLFCSVEN